MDSDYPKIIFPGMVWKTNKSRMGGDFFLSRYVCISEYTKYSPKTCFVRLLFISTSRRDNLRPYLPSKHAIVRYFSYCKFTRLPPVAARHLDPRKATRIKRFTILCPCLFRSFPPYIRVPYFEDTSEVVSWRLCESDAHQIALVALQTWDLFYILVLPPCVGVATLEHRTKIQNAVFEEDNSITL